MLFGVDTQIGMWVQDHQKITDQLNYPLKHGSYKIKFVYQNFIITTPYQSIE